MNPLNFLERLFTARALEREIAGLQIALKEKESETLQLKAQIKMLEDDKKTLEERIHRLESLNRANRRPFAISDDRPDGY